MSDSKSSYGEPVDEPNDAAHDDVVGRAHEGLADAEAARRGVDPAAPDADSETSTPESAVESASATEADAPSAPAAGTAADASRTDAAGTTAAGTDASRTDADRGVPVDEEVVVVEEKVVETPAATSWYEREDEDEARWAAYAASASTPADTADTRTPDATTAAPVADETPTVVAAPVSAPPASEPAAASPVGGAVGQPIFVQAPEAPQPRGNRGAAGAIGLLAALAFAVLYLVATLGVGLLYGTFELGGLVDATLDILPTASLWVPVVVFYIAFWFLGALINRGRWGHWVVWGLIVGVAAWAGHILGALFQAPFWMLTAREGAELVEAELLAPLAIVAFVLGRELTIWFGAWVAARGKRVTEINLEAQREYERTLEAGPQLRH